MVPCYRFCRKKDPFAYLVLPLKAYLLDLLIDSTETTQKSHFLAISRIRYHLSLMTWIARYHVYLAITLYQTDLIYE